MKVSSSKVVWFISLLILNTYFSILEIDADPDQNSPRGALWLWVHTVCHRDVLKEPADDRSETTFGRN